MFEIFCSQKVQINILYVKMSSFKWNMLRDWKIEIGRIDIMKDRIDVVIDTGACNKTSRILNMLEFLKYF